MSKDGGINFAKIFSCNKSVYETVMENTLWAWFLMDEVGANLLLKTPSHLACSSYA